jgi:hypothetical protein
MRKFVQLCCVKAGRVAQGVRRRNWSYIFPGEYGGSNPPRDPTKTARNGGDKLDAS